MELVRMDLSIIIVNYKTSELTKGAVSSVHSVMKDSEYEYEIIVVDNASDDNSYAELCTIADRNTKVYETPKNGGFGYGNNYGVKYAKGEYLFFLNSDTILQRQVLLNMLSCIKKDSSIGAMTCWMKDGDNNWLVTGHSFENVKTLFWQTIVKPLLPRKFYIQRNNHTVLKKDEIVDCDWISGAGMLIPYNVFKTVNGWNELFFMYMEDEDLCYRIHQLGKRIVIFPSYGIQHLVGASGGSAFAAYERYKSKMLYFQLTQAKHQWLIQELLFFQANRYMRGLSKKERNIVIDKLKLFAKSKNERS